MEKDKYRLSLKYMELDLSILSLTRENKIYAMICCKKNKKIGLCYNVILKQITFFFKSSNLVAETHTFKYGEVECLEFEPRTCIFYTMSQPIASWIYLSILSNPNSRLLYKVSLEI